MLADFRADLHVHTCLSPCASDTMLPPVMVAAALSKQLHIVAICDHNATDNVQAVRRAAEGQALAVIGGVEITSREEVHILGLFDNDRALHEINSLIEQHLAGRNDEEAFGEQWVVDADGGIRDISHRLLIGATSLSVERIVDAIHQLEGLAIASHIDREAFGIIGQLGFIPSGLRLDALELSPAAAVRRDEYSRQYDLPLVTSSDAHYPHDIGGSSTTFTMARVSIEEMRKALRGEEGRRAGMEWNVEDLSLHILDVAENSIKAQAKVVVIRISEYTPVNLLTVEIEDDGRGMDQVIAEKAVDPFFTTRTTRRVGLGLSMLAQSAKETGGYLVIHSAVGKGTRLKATFHSDHPDCRPIGDMQGTLATLIAGHAKIDFVYEHRLDEELTRLDTRLWKTA